MRKFMSLFQTKEKVNLNIIFKMMKISHQNYNLSQLKRQNVAQAASMLARSLIRNNKAWNTFASSQRHVYDCMTAKVNQVLDWQQEARDEGLIDQDTFLSFIYLNLDGRIIAVNLSVQLNQYLQKQSKVSFPLFDALEKYSQKCKDLVEPSDTTPGKSVFTLLVVLDNSLISSKTVMFFGFDFCVYLQSKGFKVMYARLSNVKAFTFFIKRGGKILAKTKIQQNGRQLTMSFLRWQIFSYEKVFILQTIKKMMAKL